MVFTCSYCQTGVMSTSDQYLTHINGTKHKKKVFQLQAPNDGIEYEEFRKKKETNLKIEYTGKIEDFPSLPLINNNINNSQPLEYNEIKSKLTVSQKPIVVFEEYQIETSLSSTEEVTIDEVFFKRDSKTATAKYIADNFLKSQKTPAAALNEIAKAMLWELTFEPVKALELRYAIAVLIDNIEFTIGEGENKKEAKQNAAAEAIREIKKRLRPGRDSKSNSTKTPVKCEQPIESIADCYEEITLKKMNDLQRSTKSLFSLPKRYAAFIITEKIDQHAKYGTIVAFGAGVGVNMELSQESGYPGYHVNNFDALVLAKRSLQCFFYNQIQTIFAEKGSDRAGEKLYFEIGKDGLIKLKRGCRLHLFLSHAPQGDCVESIPSKWQNPITMPRKEMERDQCGLMEPIMYMSYSQPVLLKDPGHIRVLKENTRDNWISLISHRNKSESKKNVTMSPTDKLMTWIHLGIQGAMLSHLMSPIYLYSIQFGKDYMHEHVSRALICRVPLDSIKKEKCTYYNSVKFSDPYFERVYEIREENIMNYETFESLRICFNWYLNEKTDFPEVIDTKTGCVHPDSPFKLPGGEDIGKCSRLSKVCMLVRLKECLNKAIDYFRHNQHERANFLHALTEKNYNRQKFKYFASDYRKLKMTLFQSLNEKHYGQWIPDTKRDNFDLFDFYVM